jgi:hypothetical protein
MNDVVNKDRKTGLPTEIVLRQPEPVPPDMPLLTEQRHSYNVVSRADSTSNNYSPVPREAALSKLYYE